IPTSQSPLKSCHDGIYSCFFTQNLVFITPLLVCGGYGKYQGNFPWSLFEKSFAKTLYVGPVPHPALAVGQPETK
ncbi:hypothetical protein CBF92_01270, partial [Limosilactobacillus reuteri]|uniref:hypothetical protein n=1 Tax=Limosilactobacillus reuteri TaxID=1598 RepID=UPI000BCA7FDF